MVRFLTALFIAVVASFPAASRSSVSVGVWSGPGYYGGPRHHFGQRHFGPPRHAFGYPRSYYPRHSVFVYSAPVYPVYPALVYAPPPRVIYYPSYAAVPVAPTSQCTTFNGDATIDGAGTPFYGRACIFTDGRWHIVP